MLQRHAIALAASALLCACAGPSLARVDAEALEARVNRLESQSLVDLLTRLQRLEEDVQRLRGDLEEQSHQLGTLQQQQRDLYLDLDQRLRRLEPGGASAAPGAAVPGGKPGGSTPPVMMRTPSASPSAPAQAETGETTTGAPSAGAAGGSADDGEDAAYERAFGLLKDRHYQEAAEAFRSFLNTYPKGRLADNAQYWLGEASYVTRNFPQALVEFHKLLDFYPKSAKVPDALLKVGYVNYELGQWDDARQALTELTTRYPDSAAARLAQERLQRMQQEGH